jgi:pSer/pThr/pTyr-binding forkhead associated (FHA) protein
VTHPGRPSGVGADPLARHRATPVELRELLAAEAAGVPFVALRDSDSLLVHALGERTTIGRRPTADVVIVWDGEVSGLHALIERVADECSILDAGSTNGVFVNEERLQRRRRLRDGDRIRVGRTILAFNAAVPASIAPTDVADQQPLMELTPSQRRILGELCRPYGEGGRAHPAPPSNQEIASALFVSVDTVKGNLKQLFGMFGLESVPQGQRRAVLAETVLHLGLVRPGEGR